MSAYGNVCFLSAAKIRLNTIVHSESIQSPRHIVTLLGYSLILNIFANVFTQKLTEISPFRK
jgi:hypothetical protein